MIGKHQKTIHNNTLVLDEQLESILKILIKDSKWLSQICHNIHLSFTQEYWKAITNNIVKLNIEHARHNTMVEFKDQDQFSIIPQSQNSQASSKTT